MESEYPRILIVEGEEAQALAIRQAFESQAARAAIEVVGTLQGFAERVTKKPPDIALMDLHLPDGRSMDLLTYPPEKGPFPILIMTADGNERLAVAAIKSGALDFIVKSPAAFAAMPLTVDRALREWRLLQERARAEAALRESEKKASELSIQFHALLDALPENITLQGPDLGFLWANKAAAVALNREPAEVGGVACYTAWYNRLTPCVPCPVLQSFQTGEPALEVVTLADGRIWELRTIPIKEQGRVVSMINVRRDITEHRGLEEQLRLSKKLESVGILAGGVAHDFNNLLSVINGYSELILKQMANTAPWFRELEAIHAAGVRGATLIRQLLAFSRKQVLQPRIIDLNKVIANIEKLLQRLLGEDIDLLFLPAPDLGLVKADPGQIEQIVMNLAANGRDAMPMGGRLTIETGNVELDGDYAARHISVVPGAYVLLAVTDIGVGMDPATLEHIFEPFFTTKALGRGTGLGLSTVYGIVKQSKGSIWVYSEINKGTTFKIYLPRVKDAAEEARATDVVSLARGTETILLVEDAEAVRNMAEGLLTFAGYRVLAVAGGGEALRLLEEFREPVHLLLTDVVMPGMAGPDLAARLTRLRPGLKVLYTSGYTDNTIVHHGILDRQTHFISKPFNIGELTRKIREILNTGE